MVFFQVIMKYVAKTMFQNVGIYWIIESKERFNFYFEHHFPNWILNGTGFNINICSNFHGSSFEYYFITAHKKGIILCDILSHMKNCLKHVLTMEVLVMEYHLYISQQRMLYYNLVSL